MTVTWVIEPDVFPPAYERFAEAIVAAGHESVRWRDDWWATGRWPRRDGALIFHGSLGNAAQIRRELPWRPGAFCRVEAFHCSAYYPNAARWLLHRQWHVLPAQTLVEDTAGALALIGETDSFFVRPDSPLKPFAGRVLRREQTSLRALDHGIYFDEDSLPVVIAPVRRVEREWRYVVVNNAVVAGSQYLADGRSALPDDSGGSPWRFAAEVAAGIESPESVYVMDICEADGRLFLLELNPFSGADLYACDPGVIVERVSAVAAEMGG